LPRFKGQQSRICDQNQIPEHCRKVAIRVLYFYAHRFDGSSAELTVHLTTGGVLDSAQPPASTDQDGYETMPLRFLTCNEGRTAYDIPSLMPSGEIPARRFADDNLALCEALQ
jgi:hypothetical protein